VSHPNVLDLIAVEVDGETGECLMISKLMMNGNIVDFIQSNSVNRLRLVINLLFYSANRNSSLPRLSLQMPLMA